jgi:hypothetical protein
MVKSYETSPFSSILSLEHGGLSAWTKEPALFTSQLAAQPKSKPNSLRGPLKEVVPVLLLENLISTGPLAESAEREREREAPPKMRLSLTLPSV